MEHEGTVYYDTLRCDIFSVVYSYVFLEILIFIENKFELLWYIFTGRDAGREDVPPLAAAVPEC
jgi:hypothetical protein